MGNYGDTAKRVSPFILRFLEDKILEDKKGSRSYDYCKYVSDWSKYKKYDESTKYKS